MSRPTSKQPGSSSSKFARRLWRYGPLVFWMVGIFLASTDGLSGSNTAAVIGPLLRWFFPHISDQRVELVHILVRKAAHFSEYAILALLSARAFLSSSHSALTRYWFWAAILLISVYAFSDEFHQSFVPTRTSSGFDSLIDIGGGVTALIAVAVWRKVRNPRGSLVGSQ